jgi:hypothetical protein
MVVVYPFSRLLANPKLFFAISDFLGGPDPETLRESFYELLEAESGDEPPEDFRFDVEEVYFESEEDASVVMITFDNGKMLRLEAIEGEVNAQITSEMDFIAASTVSRRLIDAIEESHPELKDDIALEHPPTPGNRFLSSENGEHFEGSFHLRSNPDVKYAFTVVGLDPDMDHLEAKIQPM